jgi:hypothetical protein
MKPSVTSRPAAPAKPCVGDRKVFQRNGGPNEKEWDEQLFRAFLEGIQL